MYLKLLLELFFSNSLGFLWVSSEESLTGLTKSKICCIVIYIRFLFSYEKIFRFVLKDTLTMF